MSTERQTNMLAIRNRGRLRSKSGQSLVEVSLMMPFLLLLAIGAIELGRFAYISILVGNAARAGAAYGAQTHITAHDTVGITAAADNDFLNNGQDIKNLTVNSVYACACDNSGTITTVDCTTGVCAAGQEKIVNLSVTASGTFNSLFSYPGLPASVAVNQTATLRIGK